MTYYVFNPLAKNNTGHLITEEFQLANLYDCTDHSSMLELEKKLKQDDIIYLIGGDGTVHYLLNNYNYLFNYELRFYKNGSGNDFYRSLNTKENYYYTINNQYHFINSFGLGFDALVCQKVNQETKKTKLSYIKQCYLTLKEYQPYSLTITYNNEKHQYHNVWLCSLQNGAYFGGGIKIARNAKTNYPNPQLCIAHSLNRFTVLILLVFVKLGLTHLFKKYFFTSEIANMEIENTTTRLAQFDGDVISLDNNIKLTANNLITIEKVNSLKTPQ